MYVCMYVGSGVGRISRKEVLSMRAKRLPNFDHTPLIEHKDAGSAPLSTPVC